MTIRRASFQNLLRISFGEGDCPIFFRDWREIGTVPQSLRLRTAMCALLLFAVVAGSAPAQQYLSEEPKLTDPAAGQMFSREVVGIWRNPSQFQNADSRQKFDQYFQDYFFPAITRTSEEGLGQTGKLRQRLLSQMLWNAPQGNLAVHKYLSEMLLTRLKDIAAKNYHPIARYNAMLIIGWLDAQPGQRGNDAAPPVPLTEAAEFMVLALQARGDVAPDVVKLGALIGLERHARYPMSDDRRKAISDELIKLVSQERPKSRSRAGHAWLQFKAAEALAQFGELGDNNRIHNALVAMMQNKNVPITERVYVAKSLSLEKLKEKYTANAGIDAKATVAALAQVLYDVIDYEEQQAKHFNEEQRAGGGLAFSPIGFDDEPPGYARDRLLHRFNSVLDAFAAVDGTLPDNLKKKVTTILKPVRDIRGIAVKKDDVDLVLTTKIEEVAPNIKDEAILLGAEKAADGEGSGDEDAAGDELSGLAG